MSFPTVTSAEWRAQVEAELKGAAFDKVLVSESAEGLRTQPLYTEARAGAELAAIMARLPDRRVRICVKCRDAAGVKEAIDGGADAVWVPAGMDLAGVDAKKTIGVVAGDAVGVVSSLPYHDAGADAADELAIVLSSGVARLRTLVTDALDLDAASKMLSVRISVGRDTFAELSKLRALRLCWAKLLVAAGVKEPPPLAVHAVCSSRTLAARDPWVNMLRTTTQIFAAILGGADLVTPLAFDDAIGALSVIGRRVARNTGLVLREESHLGRVIDPAGGSYYLETYTDELAREAWKRFQELERAGGIEEALSSGRLQARLEAAWTKRAQGLARRKEPLLGVSEFANLDEKLPVRDASYAAATSTLPVHRDSEDFEHLRDRADTLRAPTISLVTLGPASEHRARLGFASALFPAAGLRTEVATAGTVVCLCGSDERYASEGADAARALKAAGTKRVLLAGRPGALEASLREAGVDDFVFIGCDLVASGSAILDVLS